MHATLQLIFYLFWQLASYSIIAWLAFITIAFFTARYLPWWCIPIGHLIVGVIVYFLDVRWAIAQMRSPGYDPATGVDLDFVFFIGMLMRIFLINTVLLPLSYVGFRMRRHQRSLSYERPVA
jgi:hypothetical protein